MAINAASGSKLFIGGVAASTSQVLAEYQTDSYVEVGELEDLGEFGDESETIPFTSLGDGRVRKLKGPRDAGTMEVVVGDDTTDEGQTAMEAAEAETFDYNFYVELNDAVSLGGEPSRHYFVGKVMSKRRNVGNASNVVRRNFTVGINSAILSTDPT
jgi:hypothetical protein